MMSIRTSLPIFAAALAVGAAATPAQAQQPGASSAASPSGIQQVAGCYRLTVTDAVSWLSSSRVPESRRPPAQFALDHVQPRERGSTRFAVRPVWLSGRDGMPAAWELVGSDSVSVIWSTGWAGVMLRLQVVGDSLRGTARPFDDTYAVGDPPDPEAGVLAIRTTCPVELRAPAG